VTARVGDDPVVADPPAGRRPSGGAARARPSGLDELHPVAEDLLEELLSRRFGSAGVEAGSRRSAGRGTGAQRIDGSYASRSLGAAVETNATRMCALLGLPVIAVLGVKDHDGEALRVHVETTATVVGCAGCGTRAWLKDQRPVTVVDLPAFGRPTVLVWHKRRWRCPEPACDVGSFTEQQHELAAPRAGWSDRAGRWMTAQVGRGRPVSAVPAEHGSDWHTLMDAVVAYGTPLIEDPSRVRSVTTLGLDETLFVRSGRFKQRSWVTSIVDVTRPAQLLDVVEGRTAEGPSAWIDARTRTWRDSIAFAALDLSGPYRKTFNDSLPDAVQVADPFQVIKLANTKLDEVRRRVQQETLGHRGHAGNRSRRLLTKGAVSSSRARSCPPEAITPSRRAPDPSSLDTWTLPTRPSWERTRAMATRRMPARARTRS
jgi:transposase